MDLAVTPSVDDAFNALAGSSEPLTSEEKFTLSLQGEYFTTHIKF